MKENLVILGGCVSCVKVASYTAVMVKFKDKYMLAWSIEHLPMLAREIRIMPTSNLSFSFLHLFYCCIVMTIGFAFFSSARLTAQKFTIEQLNKFIDGSQVYYCSGRSVETRREG